MHPPLVLISAYVGDRTEHGIRDPDDGAGVHEMCKYWYGVDVADVVATRGPEQDDHCRWSLHDGRGLAAAGLVGPAWLFNMFARTT